MYRALQYINANPRVILLMAWPVLTALLVGLIIIIWKGPWLPMSLIQLKQLDLLGWIALGVLGIFALNQLAQSSTFFGKLGFRVGNFVNVETDMKSDAPVPAAPEPDKTYHPLPGIPLDQKPTQDLRK